RTALMKSNCSSSARLKTRYVTQERARLQRQAISRAFPDLGPRAASAPTEIPPSRPKVRRATVSLNMIVRNEEQNLPACLESGRGLFDETIVVDTGSTDRTVEIARSFGAKVSHFEWIDDFAAARNAALDRSSGDYVFWLDADDRIELSERQKLAELLDEVR